MDTKPNKIDYGVALTKGIAGAFPFIGPLVAEAVGTFIPNQRLDRITKFLEILDKKVAELDQEQVKLNSIIQSSSIYWRIVFTRPLAP